MQIDAWLKGSKKPLKGSTLVKAAIPLLKKIANSIVDDVSDNFMKTLDGAVAKTADQVVSDLGSDPMLSKLGVQPGPDTLPAVANHAYDTMTQSGATSGMIAEYAKLRSTLKQQFNSMLSQSKKAVGVPYAGPDVASDKKALTKVLRKMVADPASEVMKPIIESAAKVGMATPEALSTFLTKSLQDQLAKPATLLKVFRLACQQQGGTPAGPGNNKNACTWASARACQLHTTWPLDAKKGFAYSEWTNNACALAPGAMRAVCEGNRLTYDSSKGVCKVDESTCTDKGGTWSGGDCMIGQNLDVFETLLGPETLTTIKRTCPLGSKSDPYGKCWYDRSNSQTPMRCTPGTVEKAGTCYAEPPAGFDWLVSGEAKWVSKCPEGTQDTMTGCRYDRGVGTPMTCVAGQVQRAAECYAQPPAGWDFTTPGGLLIGKICPPGTNDSGTTCWYDRGVGTPLQCPAGQVQRGAECYQAPPEGYTWTTPGGILIGKICPPGTNDSGTTCYYDRGGGTVPLLTACPAGWRDDKTVCWRDPYGRGVGRIPSTAPCGPGQHDDGTSCWGY
jgi:hypothetical protein